MTIHKLYISALVLLSSLISAHSKELISGTVLENFKSTEKWQVAGEISAVDGQSEFIVKDGDAILYNGAKRQRAAYLYSRDEFGDMAVSLQFMVPKGSNAGVYFFGRYEIQILDSYGKKKVKFSDLGGVYQRWRSPSEAEAAGGSQGYEGVAPHMNAAKAPGEWQQMDIVFRAPRFGADGNKTENARFISVHVNGQLVQENVEVTGPTRAAPEKGDAARGSIVIQGDHGPVAIRSLRVTPLALDDYTASTEGWEQLYKGVGEQANYRKFLVSLQKYTKTPDLDNLMSYDESQNELRVLYDWKEESAPYALLLTKDKYSEFDMQLEYRWGDRKFIPRLEKKKDAGILFHVHDPVERSRWCRSLECQVQETDSGDIILIGSQATPLRQDGSVRDPGDAKRYYRTFSKYGLYETADWNTVLVKVRNDGARFYVNGHLVNQFKQPQFISNGEPLTEGYIGLQVEGAEITYRNIMIRPL